MLERSERVHVTSQHEPRASRYVWALMLVALAPFALLTIVGVIVYWPHHVESTDDRDIYTVTVTAVDAGKCQEAVTPACVTVKAGDTVVKLPQEASIPEVSDTLRVVDGQTDEEVVFIDYDRRVPLGVLGAIYVLAILVVAGFRGARALIGLSIAMVVIVGFMLPSILSGHSAIGAGLTSSAAILFSVLYLAHGLSARTTVALIGTLAGVAISGVLAVIWTRWAHLGGLYTDELFILNTYYELSASDIVICGVLISGIGVLNDVAITQVATVWELAQTAQVSSVRSLFRSAMRIGRDHIASTVYTVVFAFAGSSLAVLLVTVTSGANLFTQLTLGEMSAHVVLTLVTSIGLVCAIPLSTLIAAFVVTSDDDASHHLRENA
ncbi:YibE/F-like protein [Brevibacterium mcbrellneri ATCC 49030]|uniref:YibE/F-like protein n=1 Tax=Brevibacterium mcbrellneri ATCC 49030 TaxID=585530 RepID=D4YKP9_9MICO|nr:YibE/F family protein [Brevibacterium mcbrellneri]EFG48252.1 YibE/F-like protein [Brevibacterium mcbrellneri ATCC 49030]